MTQHTFSVGSSPHVTITQVNANLSVQTWKEQVIRVEIAGPVAELRQEGDTVVITDCPSDLVVWVPAALTTDISVVHLSGNVTIEGAGRVELKDIGGNVTLRDIVGDTKLEHVHGVVEFTNIAGDVSAAHLSKLFGKKGIAGHASFTNIAYLAVDSIGGSVVLEGAGMAEILAVGGNLDARGIEKALLCTTVGADCRVQDCAGAEVIISNVGENLQIEGKASGRMSVIGDCLEWQTTFPAGSSTRLHVGGDATVTLPDDVSLTLYAMVGGEVNVEALGSGGGNMLNFIYGDGSARLDLLVEGDLRLLGPAVPQMIPYL